MHNLDDGKPITGQYQENLTMERTNNIPDNKGMLKQILKAVLTHHMIDD